MAFQRRAQIVLRPGQVALAPIEIGDFETIFHLTGDIHDRQIDIPLCKLSLDELPKIPAAIGLGWPLKEFVLNVQQIFDPALLRRIGRIALFAPAESGSEALAPAGPRPRREVAHTGVGRFQNRVREGGQEVRIRLTPWMVYPP